MKIEIKLSDPKYCNGCPYFNEDGYNHYCSRGRGRQIKSVYVEKLGYQGKRPQICVKTNGE